MSQVTEKSAPRPERRSQSYFGLAIAGLFVVLPAVLFYTILFRTSLDLPFLDGYDGLDFMNRLTQLKGLYPKAQFVLAAQHGEYKVVFAEILTWLQYSIMGHINFNVMSALSNSFVLIIALVLWKMFLPGHKDLNLRLALFIPASWLLFQLEYFEILNWGGSGLQHIPSTAFAFAAIYFLFQQTRIAFYGALLCFILAVASSGNGFFLFPIGLVALAPNRSYLRMVGWCIACAGCIAVYSYHYNVMSSQASPDHSIFSALLGLRPIFIISFIGSAASVPFPPASFVLGTSLCIFFFWMARRGYVRRNPAVSCCVLFLLLTAIGVAGIRSDLGLAGSTPSRYTLFSILFVIFAWFAIAEEFLQHSRVSLLNNTAYHGAVAVAVLFCLFMDSLNSIFIRNWDAKLIEGMTSFEHPNPPDSTIGPVIRLWKGDIDRDAFNAKARIILFESIRLGVYRPPQL